MTKLLSISTLKNHSVIPGIIAFPVNRVILKLYTATNQTFPGQTNHARRINERKSVFRNAWKVHIFYAKIVSYPGPRAYVMVKLVWERPVFLLRMCSARASSTASNHVLSRGRVPTTILKSCYLLLRRSVRHF